MSIEPRTLDPALSIGTIVQRYPAALGVFNTYGLDVCCGGGLSLAEVARRHGLGLPELLTALEAAVAGATR